MVYNIKEYAQLENGYKYPYQIKIPRQQLTIHPEVSNLFVSPEAFQDLQNWTPTESGCVSEWICPECNKKQLLGIQNE